MKEERPKSWAVVSRDDWMDGERYMKEGRKALERWRG